MAPAADPVCMRREPAPAAVPARDDRLHPAAGLPARPAVRSDRPARGGRAGPRRRLRRPSLLDRDAEPELRDRRAQRRRLPPIGAAQRSQPGRRHAAGLDGPGARRCRCRSGSPARTCSRRCRRIPGRRSASTCSAGRRAWPRGPPSASTRAAAACAVSASTRPATAPVEAMSGAALIERINRSGAAFRQRRARRAEGPGLVRPQRRAAGAAGALPSRRRHEFLRRHGEPRAALGTAQRPRVGLSHQGGACPLEALRPRRPAGGQARGDAGRAGGACGARRSARPPPEKRRRWRSCRSAAGTVLRPADGGRRRRRRRLARRARRLRRRRRAASASTCRRRRRRRQRLRRQPCWSPRAGSGPAAASRSAGAGAAARADLRRLLVRRAAFGKDRVMTSSSPGDSEPALARRRRVGGGAGLVARGDAGRRLVSVARPAGEHPRLAEGAGQRPRRPGRAALARGPAASVLEHRHRRRHPAELRIERRPAAAASERHRHPSRCPHRPELPAVPAGHARHRRPGARRAVLGGHVDIGAGAKVLGGVTIGAHAVIGANAVVLCDVPAGATAVGIPARIVSRAPSPVGRPRPETPA